MTILILEGIEEESGNYSCKLSNNIGVAYKNFSVNFVENASNLIGYEARIVMIVIWPVLLIVAIGIGIKLYIDKVRSTVLSAIRQ